MEREVFADDNVQRPLALHPAAIGVDYGPQTSVRATSLEGIAVMHIDGPLAHKPDASGWCYWENYEQIASAFLESIADEEVRAVVLKIDSPGGDVAGLFETVRIMTEAKQQSGKRVIAYVDEDCYSAAYALALVADEIYVPPTGNVGSIGVITVMAEMTAADKKDGFRFEVISSGAQKTDGHPHVALSESAIGRTQDKVDGLALLFFDLVASARGLTRAAVAGMQAATFTGEAAVDAELADGVMSLAECLTLAANEFSQPIGPRRSGVKPMSLLAATKALNDANAALAAAKTDKERSSAAAAVEKAELKYKHVKKTVETVESEDPADMPEKAEDEDEDEETDDEDEAAAALTEPTDIVALTRKLTGKSTTEEIVGALHAMARTESVNRKLVAEVASLRAKVTRDEVTALVTRGMKAGKIAPAQKKWAMAQSPPTLQAYLDATPKMVHTIEDQHTEARVDAAFGAVTPEMAKIWAKQGFTPADFPGLLAKLNGTTPNGAS